MTNQPKTKSRLEIAFDQFHKANPRVYSLFKNFTFKVIRRGFSNFSSDMILHRIRWYSVIETSGDTFKLNNNFSAYYARLFMSNFPQHKGFFRTRTVKEPADFTNANDNTLELQGCSTT